MRRGGERMARRPREGVCWDTMLVRGGKLICDGFEVLDGVMIGKMLMLEIISVLRWKGDE